MLNYTRETIELEDEKIMKMEKMKTEGKEKGGPKVKSELKEKSAVNYKRNI